jgi:hypothetical protein
MAYTAEAVPVTIIESLLFDNWDTNSGNIPKPSLVDVNNATDPLRADLINTGDYVLLKADTPTFEETPIGTWVYGNQRHNILLEIYTAESRQRLYDIQKEIRRVIHDNMHSVTQFQRIQYRSFNELVQEYVNIWGGRIIIECLNSSILLNTET